MPTSLNPQITGAVPLPYEAPDLPGAVGGNPSELLNQGTVSPVAGLRGTEGNNLALHQQVAAANRVEASTIEAIGAGMSQWSVVQAYDFLTRQTYEPEPGYNGGDALNHIPYVLEEGERDFIARAVNPADTADRVARVKDSRIARQATQGNAVASFLTAVADPGMLAMDALGLGVGHMANLGRVGAGAVAAGGNLALGMVQREVDPNMQVKDVVLNSMLSGLGTSLAFKGSTKHDPDFPAQTLQQHLQSFQGPLRPGTTPMGPKPKVTVEEAAASGRTIQNLTPEEVTVDVGKSFMSRLEWSVSRSMGKINAKVRDLLVDSTDLSKTSVESQKRAIEADLRGSQYKMEDFALEIMAKRGAGLMKRLNPFESGTLETQKRLNLELKNELMRREELSRQGKPITFDNVDPDIRKLADMHQVVVDRAGAEMRAAGVVGAEELQSRQGWFSRRWNSARIGSVEQKFIDAGMDAEKAHQAVVKLVGLAVRRANPTMDMQVAYDVGASIINRAKRKGYFEDTVFSTNQGNKVMAEVRDALEDSGIRGDRAKRVMQLLEGHNDEAGKASFLKHRIDLDYKAAIVGPDGKLIKVHELIDDNVMHTTDRYIEGASAQAAWARTGIKTESQLDEMRRAFIEAAGAPESQAVKEAAQLFDNVVASIDGRPAGVNLTEGWRMFQQLNRMVSLRNSGVYQLSEYSTAMAEFGVLKTLKYAVAEMPGFRYFSRGASTAGEAKRLSRIVAEVGSQDVRIRPYIHKFEDNFEVGAHEAAHLKINSASQLVPYLNGMKFVHAHQAAMVGRLIEDRVVQAAKGNKKAQEALAQYGISGHVWERLRREISVNGSSIDNWSAGSWEAVRPSMAKMMDESVLRARIGDVPAFAQFDPVGKFVFAFRSFILTAHNKLLVGRSEREGMVGLGLLLAYQYPLAALATALQNKLSGKEEMTEKELAAKTVANMGSIGLLSEPVSVVTGERRSAGAPGIILADRIYKAAGLTSQAAFGNGDVDKAMAAGLDLVPLLAIPYPVQHIGEQLKTKE